MIYRQVTQVSRPYWRKGTLTEVSCGLLSHTVALPPARIRLAFVRGVPT